MIDTLKIVEILEKEMDEPKARAVARAIDEAVKQAGETTVEQLERKLVTKDEFYAALRELQKQMANLQTGQAKQMAELEARLLRWSVGFWVTAIAAIVASRWIR